MKPTRKIETSIIEGKQEYFIAEVRKEDLPRWKIQLSVNASGEEPFDKDKTVFKPWIPDTTASLAGALRCDLGHWRAHRFIKDPEDMR